MNVIHVPRPNLHNNLLIVLTIKFILQTRELSNQWHNMCIYIYIYIYIGMICVLGNVDQGFHWITI
jgi:hypothetical protein